jgi:hypothetical protein
LAIGFTVLGVADIVVLIGVAQARDSLVQHEHYIRREAAATVVATRATIPSGVNDNLETFYNSLGDRRHVETQVKILYGLSAKSGLTLPRGDYNVGYQKDAKIYTYQVSLPVKAKYQEVRHFALLSLGALPFASLDQISLKRDAAGDANVEARLRFTFYLSGESTGAVR